MIDGQNNQVSGEDRPIWHPFLNSTRQQTSRRPSTFDMEWIWSGSRVMNHDKTSDRQPSQPWLTHVDETARNLVNPLRWKMTCKGHPKFQREKKHFITPNKGCSQNRHSDQPRHLVSWFMLSRLCMSLCGWVFKTRGNLGNMNTL